MRATNELDTAWPMLFTFIIAIATFYLSSTVGMYNLIRGHLLDGHTMIEFRHKQHHHKVHCSSPFNRGFKENFKHTFGQPGPGWFFPTRAYLYKGNIHEMHKKWGYKLPPDPNDDRNRLKPILGVTYNSISKDFWRHACKDMKNVEPKALDKYYNKYQKAI